MMPQSRTEDLPDYTKADTVSVSKGWAIKFNYRVEHESGTNDMHETQVKFTCTSEDHLGDSISEWCCDSNN